MLRDANAGMFRGLVPEPLTLASGSLLAESNLGCADEYA